MKKLIRLLMLIGVIFTIMRIFLLVVKAKKPIGEAITSALLIPIQFLGTVFTLAASPAKYKDAANIVTQGFEDASTQPLSYKSVQTASFKTYNELVTLSGEEPEHATGTERAQLEPPISTQSTQSSATLPIYASPELPADAYQTDPQYMPQSGT